MLDELSMYHLHDNAGNTENEEADEEADDDEKKKIKIADNFFECFLCHNFGCFSC